ncbi:MAG: hypothetical protein H6739_29175 [Alphaproteobacteria bacterium]|nr:hypothetical protein [Alphaproteobacteria bacterium]
MPPQDQGVVPAVPLGGFLAELLEHLPRLLALMKSRALAEHPRWGSLLPFHLPLFGGRASIGHCVRPDVLITEDGPMICELDFVPAGRGVTLLGLPVVAQQRAFLGAFAAWYRGLGFDTILYASATVDEDITLGDMRRFCVGMREHLEVDVHHANIDDVQSFDGLIDRLYYASEMRSPRPVIDGGASIVTAEPWLDSKMIFAVVHDQASDPFLLSHLGEDALRFFRRVFPRSYDLAQLRRTDPALLRRITATSTPDAPAERKRWLLKSTAADSWGSRGVVLGASYSGRRFREAVMRGVSPRRKDLGARPLLQRFVPSVDFTAVWDGLVEGRYHQVDPRAVGHRADPVTLAPASRPVHARFGPYVLVDTARGALTVAPYGVGVFRQDELVHGSKDAILCAVRFDGEAVTWRDDGAGAEGRGPRP